MGDRMEIEVVDMAWKKPMGRSVIALGFFDGFHIGHQVVLKETIEQAQKNEAIPVVLTFDCHPWEVLFPEKQPQRLISEQDKSLYLRNFGFEKLLLLKSSEKFLNESAEHFLEWLKNSLNPVGLVSGPNYTFGSQKSGNVEFLSKWGIQNNINVTTMNPVMMDDVIVSSTRIRELLKVGEISRANKLLGRYFHLDGVVVHGDGRGRLLGFPTANMKINDCLILPSDGVYGVKVKVETNWYSGVASIGTNPTFSGERSRRLEVHILELDENLYDQELRVAFCQYLRPENSFENKEALILQIKNDIAFACEYLENNIEEIMLPNWVK
jgi:riboflavin kinase/FMN adenylyltransferase